MVENKPRSLQQNKALHKWCDELARECQSIGVPYKVIVQNLQIDWTPEAIKSIIQAVLKAMYGINKTSEATTVQLSSACKEVDRIFLEQGVNISFPSFEDKNFNEHYDTIR